MRLLCASAIILACIALPGLAGAQAPQSEQTTQVVKNPKTSQEWELTADRVSTNHAAGIVQAWGHAVLRSGNDYLSGDFIEYFRDSGWIYLKGNVHSYWHDYDIYADEAQFDLVNKTGKLTNGILFIEQGSLVVKGKEFDKTGEDTYTFTEATLTGCEGSNPAWSIKTDTGDLTVGDYANVYSSQFLVKGTPILYAPYMRVPLRADRQTGFLPPTYGSSSRLGGFYSQPFFWAIDAERDLTAYADYFGKRGPMVGLEYRSADDAQTHGLWRMDYIDDKVVVDNQSEQEEEFENSGLIRTNHQRYWLRSKYDGWTFDPDYQVKLDLDYASDQTFLRTYNHLHTRYSQSYNDFLNDFGRGIDTIDSLTRTSTGLATRTWGGEYAMNLRAAYTENFNYMNGNQPGDKNPTVQVLPELSAYAYKQQLLNSPFEIQADSSLTYFTRNYGTSGGRFDVLPQLSLPLASPYGSIIPRMGWRETMYSATQDNSSSDVDEGTQDRQLFSYGAAAFSEVSGTYDLGTPPALLAPDASLAGTSTWVGLRHAIQPRVDYSWTQNVEQRSLPEYDQYDRIGAQNQVTYSLTNLLNRKRGTVNVAKDEDGKPDPFVAYSYRDFLRLLIEQSYDFREADRNTDLNEYPRRPFGDVLAQTDFYPLDWLSLTNKTYTSPYGEGITRFENTVGFYDPQYGQLSVGFTQYSKIDEYKRQNRSAINMLTLRGQLNLPQDLTLETVYQYDIRNDIPITTDIGLTWHAQCYDVTAFYSATQYDRSIALWVSILGFKSPGISLSQNTNNSN
ncbi:LPS-assembly protein LptD [Desulfovibrio sp. X2]|uniref:LPS-assembly protein LptD n=1 Tax=Desulfovibrio sp. X2 TaxID=941449 RepID=UPI000403E70A|nr:LPS assembly protein LptD [Desulfovibrio sp. X2]